MGGLWLLFNEQRQRLSLKTQIAAGLFLAVMVFLGLYTVLSSKDSILHLRVQHSFRSARIAVFVDNEAVYSGTLNGVMKKKYVVFGDTLEGSLSHDIPVTSGSHRVRVQITSGDGTTEQDSVLGDIAKNSERTLLVRARSGDVALSWQGGSSGSEESSVASAGESWMGRYAGTLILTVAGSIVSALTGFVIRELPGYLKSRQSSQ